MHIFQRAETHPWWQERLDSRFNAVSTMVSAPELKMLVWLARNLTFEDDGVMVDAGCFLGGSTVALALGLRDNPSRLRKESRLLAYDRFDNGNDHFMHASAQRGNKVSNDPLTQFRANLAELNPLVTVICGDFLHAPPPEGPISLLFIDVAKTWSLNQRIVSAYFPRLSVGSIVVQQDHNDQCCPWVGLTMEHFSAYFEPILNERSSRLYRVIKPVPRELGSEPLEQMPYERKIGLLERARGRMQDETSIYMSAVAQAWLVYGHEGQRAAFDYLDRLPPQPWSSERPYRDMVRRNIEIRETMRISAEGERSGH